MIRPAPPEFVRVGRARDVRPGHAKAFVVGPWEVAVFNVAGQFFALENRCPHQGGPLAEGWLDGTQITCPWHAWCFDVRTGAMELGEYAHVQPFDVFERDGSIYVSADPRDA